MLQWHGHSTRPSAAASREALPVEGSRFTCWDLAKIAVCFACARDDIEERFQTTSGSILGGVYLLKEVVLWPIHRVGFSKGRCIMYMVLPKR